MDEVKSTRSADKEKIERQNQQLSDYEAEINLLRRCVTHALTMQLEHLFIT